MRNSNLLKILAALGAGLILCGCTSNSADGAPVNSVAQGIYCGSFTATFGSTGSSSSSGSNSSSSSGTSGSSGFCGGSDSLPVFFGMVQADGTAVFFTKQNSNLVLYAPAALTAANFSLPVNAIGLNGSIVRTVAGGTDSGTLTGTVASGDLSGSISDDYGNTVDFVATANADTWARASSLATVAGSYKGSFSLNSTTYAPTLAIDSSGNITGSDSGGCSYGGAVTTPDALHNDYNMKLTSSCLSGQTFSGIGAYFPAGLSNPNGILSPAELKVGLSNGTASGIYLNLSLSN